MYVAFWTTPGFMPDTAEEHPRFETVEEAWAYLLNEYTDRLNEVEDEATNPPLETQQANFNLFREAASVWPGIHSVTVRTPGRYSVNGDLGISYEVHEVEPTEEEAAEAKASMDEAAEAQRRAFLETPMMAVDPVERARWHGETARSELAAYPEKYKGYANVVQIHALLSIAASLEELVFVLRGDQ